MEVRRSWMIYISIFDYLVLVSIVQALYYYTHQRDTWVLKTLVPLFFLYMCVVRQSNWMLWGCCSDDFRYDSSNFDNPLRWSSYYRIPMRFLKSSSLYLHNYALGRSPRAATTSLVTFTLTHQFNRHQYPYLQEHDGMPNICFPKMDLTCGCSSH